MEYAMISIYGVVFIIVIYMTSVFLIRLKFYKEPHLLAFYILSYLIIFLRIVYFSTAIEIDREYEAKNMKN